jgi:pimeloyl-ACP methyl ester carboxylesterase
MLTPDFSGSFTERMEQLYPILGNRRDWTIIGSSFGGLMGAVFTCTHPQQVRKLILLAPALILPEFSTAGFSNISTPTVLVHGTLDEIVPPEPVRQLAQQTFNNLNYIEAEDGHRLQQAFLQLDWDAILE